MIGLRVLLFHPEWAARSCHECQMYRYVEDKSDPLYGKPMERPIGSGNKITRDRGEFTPCKTCPKIFHGDPKLPMYAQELSEKNQKAWRHWQECRATGHFPDDPIVKRNAAIIQRIYDDYQRKPMSDLTSIIPLLVTKRG